MTKADARAWMDRWRRLDEFKIEEARTDSLDQRLSDLDLLFASESLFPSPNREAEEAELAEVRRCWIRLKALADGK